MRAAGDGDADGLLGAIDLVRTFLLAFLWLRFETGVLLGGPVALFLSGESREMSIRSARVWL